MLNKVNDTEDLKKVSFFIPSFHINAHKSECVARFHPSNQTSLGLLDGEAVERLWSQLVSFSYTTRNMGKGVRKEQLEDCFVGIQRKIYWRLPCTLLSKRTRLQRQLNVLSLSTDYRQPNEDIV